MKNHNTALYGVGYNFPCCDEIGTTKWEEEPFAATEDIIQSMWSNHLFQILNIEQTQYWYALLPKTAECTRLPVKAMLNMIMSTASAQVEVYWTKCFWLSRGWNYLFMAWNDGTRCLPHKCSGVWYAMCC